MEPNMRSAASRDGGRRELTHRVCRMLLFIVGNDRRAIVEIAKIEPSAAILLDIEIVSLAPDARSEGVTYGTRQFNLCRGLITLSHVLKRDIHGKVRHLVGHRSTFSLIGIQYLS